MQHALSSLYRIPDYSSQKAIATAIAGDLRSRAHLAQFLSSEPRFVVVKPNWVQESHELKPEVWEPVITHPTVLLGTIEALAGLMQSGGKICICDAPHTYASFTAITARGNLLAGLDALRKRWPQLTIDVLDLRRETWIRQEEVVTERRPNPHDPQGYVRLNLGRDSLFYRHKGQGHYYGADYDSAVVNAHHYGDVHEYLLAGTPMACDLFVNVPKLKTHKKTGITCCLKNLVGINGDKNWLPHHTEGSPRQGGDEFPNDKLRNRIERRAKQAGRSLALRVPFLGTWIYRKVRNAGKQLLGDSETTVRNGNWSGNDTCWRMALDLNRALLFGNMDGSWRTALAPKHYYGVVDGIIGGEGNGPLCPDPVASGVLIAGENPAELDAIAATLMGFSPKDLPIVSFAFAQHQWPISAKSLDDLTVKDGEKVTPLRFLAPVVPQGFRPHFGWSALHRASTHVP